MEQQVAQGLREIRVPKEPQVLRVTWDHLPALDYLELRVLLDHRVIRVLRVLQGRVLLDPLELLVSLV